MSVPTPYEEPPIHGWTLERHLGCISVVRTDIGALRRRQAREALRASADAVLDPVEQIAAELFVDDAQLATREIRASRELEDGRPAVRGKVTGWSYKSRLRLLRTIAECDMSGRWGMLTLTLPGDWYLYTPSPDDWKRHLRSFWKRWARTYGSPMETVWKLESQRRSAPHAHLGFRLPDTDADMSAWSKRTWHSLVVHDGSACEPASCPDLGHAHYGAQLDTRYSDRLDGKSLASYFAKHGTWRTKAYQNTSPGEVLRRGAALISFLSGVPLPPSFYGAESIAPPSQRQQMERLFQFMANPSRFPNFEGRWDAVLPIVLAWDSPGRWWGVRGLDRPAPLEVGLLEGEVDAMRLICRKVFTRRTTREALIARPGHLPIPYTARRSLRSLRGSAGWWMLSSEPEQFVEWLLEQSVLLAQVPPGVARARWLVGIREPGDTTRLARGGPASVSPAHCVQ